MKLRREIPGPKDGGGGRGSGSKNRIERDESGESGAETDRYGDKDERGAENKDEFVSLVKRFRWLAGC